MIPRLLRLLFLSRSYTAVSISSCVAYIFEYGLSLSIDLLLRLNLQPIAELCLFEHQTRLLRLLLLFWFVNFIRSLWSWCFLGFFMIVNSTSLARGKKPENTGTISGYCLGCRPHLLLLYIFRWLGIFILFRIFNPFMYILSRDRGSRRHTHQFLMFCVIAIRRSIYEIRNKVSFVKQRHILWDLGRKSVQCLFRRGNHHVMKPVALHSFSLPLRLYSLFQLLFLHAQLLKLS